MRRRQVFSNRIEPHPAPVSAAVIEEPKANPLPKKKGVCRFCGDYIGRGIAFHEKKCSR